MSETEPEVEKSLLTEVLSGVTVTEAAEGLEIDPDEALRMVESKVAQLTDPDDFETLEDALDYLRIGRLQKALWKRAGYRAEESHQALNLMEKRSALQKGRERSETLTEMVQHMLHSNNVEITDSEEQDNE